MRQQIAGPEDFPQTRPIVSVQIQTLEIRFIVERVVDDLIRVIN